VVKVNCVQMCECCNGGGVHFDCLASKFTGFSLTLTGTVPRAPKIGGTCTACTSQKLGVDDLHCSEALCCQYYCGPATEG